MTSVQDLTAAGARNEGDVYLEDNAGERKALQIHPEAVHRREAREVFTLTH